MSFEIWEAPSICDCNHCKGGTNKHAWSFYYFCKRMGDKVTMTKRGNVLEMRKYT